MMVMCDDIVSVEYGKKERKKEEEGQHGFLIHYTLVMKHHNNKIMQYPVNPLHINPIFITYITIAAEADDMISGSRPHLSVYLSVSVV